jgi:hypothetical protein
MPSAFPPIKPSSKIVIAGLGSALLYMLLILSERGMLLKGLRHERAASGGMAGQAGPEPLAGTLLGYVGAVIGLFVLYFVVVSLARRGELEDRRVRTIVFLFPVLIGLGLLFTRPYLSIDLLSYVAQGHLGASPDQNPYSHGANVVIDTAVGRELVGFGWRPVHGISPYGALWTQLEVLAVRWTTSVAGSILVLKAFVVAAMFGSAALIWKILGRLRPEARMLGTVLFLWNPLIIVEFAGEGHNDAVMIVFVLAALLFWLSRREVLSYLALGLGVLTKYLPLMLLPALAFQFWPKKGQWKRFALGAIAALALGSAAAFLLYRPLWIGRDTFGGVFLMGQAEHSSTLPAGLLYWIFKLFMPAAEAGRISSKIVGIPFGIFVLAMSWVLRNQKRLTEIALCIFLAYMLLGASVYWSWYACLPVALLALTPTPAYVSLALVLSLCARIAAPLDLLIRPGLLTGRWSFVLTSAIGTTLPLLIILGWVLRRRLLGPDPSEQPRIPERV